jgi:hypothetical protein
VTVPITSRFEKFLAGLNVIHTHQAAAHMRAEHGQFLVGNASDPFLSKGMIKHLEELGFGIDEKTSQFVFDLRE